MCSLAVGVDAGYPKQQGNIVDSNLTSSAGSVGGSPSIAVIAKNTITTSQSFCC